MIDELIEWKIEEINEKVVKGKVKIYLKKSLNFEEVKTISMRIRATSSITARK